MTTKRVLLIDADIVAYRFAFAGQSVHDWGDGVVSMSADLDKAKAEADAHVDHMVGKVGADAFVLALSHERNFRKEIDPTYKANRKTVAKPMVLGPLVEHLRGKPEAKVKPDLEADDVIGIMLTNPKVLRGYKKACVSIDKDLRSVPGWHIDPRDDDLKPEKVTPEQADRQFFMQVLTGDRVDNYPGCPGIGDKRAGRILDAVDTDTVLAHWLAIVEAYEKAGKTEEDALLQARLARILQHQDYDYKNKRPILWSPPKE